MQRVKIGVLGAGRGAGLARTMQQAPSAELAAVCDADEARLANAVAATGVGRTYTTYEAMLDSDVDAILVASPMPLHVEHSVAALRAGKHVLSEVTAATSLEQCWELLGAVRDTGRKYMMAENYCYMRPWSVVLGMVRAGLFGEVYYGEADQIQEFKGGFPRPDTGYNWRTAELAMRQGHQYITHNLGPLYWAFGERVASVACHGSGQRHLPWAKADSTCVVLCETVSGKLLRIRLDFFSDRPNNYMYLGLQGTRAAYEAPRAGNEDHKVYVEGRTPRGAWQSLWDYEEHLPDAWRRMPADQVNDNHDGGAALMIEDFARCILDDTKPAVDVVDALNMTAPGLLSELSRQRGGAPVDVPEFRREG
ncbi:MAG: Gfo/Idh/MocA family oxidoreductase [Armatimonadetes bacterium]|nr:Gfo/Idh/MocA family oxidoreductase [Armatimonadota bacterium]